jgi:hypothetical protein
VCLRPSRPERHDRYITVDEGSFRVVGVVTWVKLMAVNCIDNNGPPWRGGMRTNKTTVVVTCGADHGAMACCGVSMRMKTSRP